MSSHNSTPSTAGAVAQASGALGVSTQPLYDFSNMPVTLEQQIADTLVRIETLLTPVPNPEPTRIEKPSREDQIAALAAKSGTRRK